MSEKRAHIFIEGEVQGVFYRAWTRSQAEKLGLTGWVKNLQDGRVEAVFQGPREQIEAMIEKCKAGSKLARPSFVDVTWEDAKSSIKEFEIKR